MPPSPRKPGSPSSKKPTTPSKAAPQQSQARKPPKSSANFPQSEPVDIPPKPRKPVPWEQRPNPKSIMINSRLERLDQYPYMVPEARWRIVHGADPLPPEMSEDQLDNLRRLGIYKGDEW
eukprot:scpid109221/ scgid7759/ 